ncbi:UDP-N-acetylglucosamine 2-epimerase [Fundidesulfovibrio agrisoli]|uniref:UDP-N-acetylglucosamine 2-epimerase n=1 Tax=Fundidesulfovibrio agrisoli TaxID=2922717 RepID=UPI001FAE55A5|nr:UDP-N-acetylglucosamine 2-epimerase [Fundidesulfovibrio agrisoli]
MNKTAWVHSCQEEDDAEQEKKELVGNVLELRKSYPDARVVNMYHTFRGETLPFEHTYYKDLIPYQDEIALYAKAYDTADIIISQAALTQNPLVEASFSALYHSIASQFFYYFSYEYLLDKFKEDGIILISSYNCGSTDELLETKKLLDKMKLLILETQGDEVDALDRPKDHIVSPDKTILLSCEDSGSGINRKTYMSIGKQLIDMGFDVYFYCLTEETETQLKNFAAHVIRHSEKDGDNPLACTLALSNCMDTLITGFLAARTRGLLPRISYRAPLMAGPDALNSFLVTTLFSIYEKFAHYMASFEFAFASVKNIAAQGVRKVVAVNEGDTSSSFLLNAASHFDLDSIGVSPILYSDHPASRFFPAKKHLVYGSQLADLMVKSGIEADSIIPVGSVHYDQAYGRDKSVDVAYTQRIIPEWDGRPLIVVATENRSNQLTEIRPTLEALRHRTDLFVVIKLHPGDPIDLFESLLADLGNPGHFKLIEKCDVLAVIHASSLLITMSSNLVIEAAVMGNISLSYNYSSSIPIFDFVAEGLCLGARSPDECISKIDMLVSDTPMRRDAFAMLKNVEKFCTAVDGASADRILKHILNSDS